MVLSEGSHTNTLQQEENYLCRGLCAEVLLKLKPSVSIAAGFSIMCACVWVCSKSKKQRQKCVCVCQEVVTGLVVERERERNES